MALTRLKNRGITDDTITEAKWGGGQFGRKNIIINGDMRLAQRDTQVTGVTGGAYRTCDRWYIAPNNLGTWTIDQSTDAPDGFKYSLKLTCTTAEASPDSTDYVFIRQKIERQNVEHLKWGTSDALPLTLSFWVKSNKTGTFGIETQANSTTTVETSADVTINSADTWEYKTVTIPANTSYALDDSDNGHGISIWFWLNAGPTYLGTPHSDWANQDNAGRAGTVTAGIGETVNDYFAFTGVQLEVGSVATPFEHRSYGEELALCQRYYQKINSYGMSMTATSTTWGVGSLVFPVTMRTSPTFSADDVNRVTQPNVVDLYSNQSFPNTFGHYSTHLSFVTDNDDNDNSVDNTYIINQSGATSYFYLDAEL